MFFGMDKADFSRPRWRAGLPFFLLFWLASSCLFIVFLLIIRGQLQRQENQETERLAAAFVKERSLKEIYQETNSGQNIQPLSDLVFIRLIHDNEHLIRIQDNNQFGLNFQEIVDLAPDKSGVWLRLNGAGSDSVLTIFSRNLAEGVVFQVGKDARPTYSLFKRLSTAVYLLEGVSFFLSWFLALICSKASLVPLKVINDRLALIEQGGVSSQYSAKSSNQELDALLAQIDCLAQKNRHLVAEMQASLDNVAHDLRTPMTRLRSVAEYGLQAMDEPERLREALSDCLEESERVLAMLRIMMSVAEAESGTMRLEVESWDLEHSLRDMVDVYTYVAEEKNMEVRLRLQSGLQVKGDKTRMAQVWGNLLDNAIKYGRERGWIEIRSMTEDATMLRIDFEDNGMGISQNEIGRIWDRLYRGDRSRSQQGLGLGLNYVRAVVLAHGGEVRVRSTLNQGSCFSVYLPAS